MTASNKMSRKSLLTCFVMSLCCFLCQASIAENAQSMPSHTNPSHSEKTESDILWHQIFNGKHRDENSPLRDQYRHPRETLDFFEVDPNMHVAEIWPGSKGWYTEILAPYLKNKGKLYAAHFHPASPLAFFRKSHQIFIKQIGEHSEVYKNISVTALQPPRHIEIAPKNALDRVLTFRNVHNWIKSGHEKVVFSAMFDALKPGGILGVVEHRGKEKMSRTDILESGYVPEGMVIEIAEKAGFKLVSKSEVNANLKDTTIHPKGVWTLPPSLRLGDQDRDKYIAIGESDRMTLKFIKPETD